jgi:hypothetical protein
MNTRRSQDHNEFGFLGSANACRLFLCREQSFEGRLFRCSSRNDRWYTCSSTRYERFLQPQRQYHRLTRRNGLLPPLLSRASSLTSQDEVKVVVVGPACSKSRLVVSVSITLSSLCTNCFSHRKWNFHLHHHKSKRILVSDRQSTTIPEFLYIVELEA